MDLQQKTLILGKGYVGSAYAARHPKAITTSRGECSTEDSQSLQFILSERETWKNIPKVQQVLWTFPSAQNAAEEELCQEFYTEHLSHAQVIVLSSTSRYIVKNIDKLTNTQNTSPPFVDEETEWKTTIPRFSAEEKLRQQGASLFVLSGIIGPNRWPLIWYQKNLVLYGQNTLNYIHVNDIVYLIEAFFAKFYPGTIWNVSSGDYKTHSQIAARLIEQKKLPSTFSFLHSENTSADNKRVLNERLWQYLGKNDTYFIKYPND